MKPVVVGIIYRRVGDRIQILTQLRLVQNKKYDSLYDKTYEAIGETLNQGEGVIDALLRGVAEECGQPDFKPVSIGDPKDQTIWITGKTIWTTGKGDQIGCLEPFCFVQQMGPPQPWIGPVFLIEVPSDWEPDHSKSDGEAGEPRWWDPSELLRQIQRTPEKFMGLHLPALYKFAFRIVKGRFI